MFSIGHVLWIAAVYLLAFVPFRDNPGAGLWGMIGIGIVPLFMGVWTFQAEGGRRIRFLADHGLPPQVVWLTKQLVWGLLTVALSVPFVVAVAVGNSNILQTLQTGTSAFHPGVPGASATLFAALLACLGYTGGQFASMLIARGVTAGFVGGVLSYALGLLTWLMIDLRVPIAISVAPVIVVLLATTCCWSRHWLLEQATGRSWLKLALVLGLSLAAVYAGVGAFRVYEVPRPEFVENIALQRNAHGRPVMSPEAETANLYRQAVAELKPADLKWDDKAAGDRPVAGALTAVDGWQHATVREGNLLAENQAALRLGLTATERPTCAFYDATRPLPEMKRDFISAISFDGCKRLAMLILLSARELEAQGRLDEALERYVAVLRLARHFANHGITFNWSLGSNFESMVANWIGTWAAHADQTADRLAAAAVRLGNEESLFPTLQDAVLTEQFVLRRTVEEDWSELLSKYENPGAEAQSRTALKVLERLCPWEHERALRVLDLIGASELHCLHVLAWGLSTPGLDMQHLARIAGAVETDADPTQLLNSRPDEMFSGTRRAEAAFSIRSRWAPLNGSECRGTG